MYCIIQDKIWFHLYISSSLKYLYAHMLRERAIRWIMGYLCNNVIRILKIAKDIVLFKMKCHFTCTYLWSTCLRIGSLKPRSNLKIAYYMGYVCNDVICTFEIAPGLFYYSRWSIISLVFLHSHTACSLKAQLGKLHITWVTCVIT